jgi:hypothetical protein
LNAILGASLFRSGGYHQIQFSAPPPATVVPGLAKQVTAGLANAG